MKIELRPASIELKPIIQNMARFYAYDMSKYCGYLPNWEFPDNGLYDALDLSPYWDEPQRYPFIIYIDDELAGFALVNTLASTPDVDWNMGEFFIVAKFQNKGIGRTIAIQLFNQFPGTWEVMQMPPNTPAIAFWKKVINAYTKGVFSEMRKTIPTPEPHDMIVLKFKTQ